MFTAIMMTRAVVNLMYGGKRVAHALHLTTEPALVRSAGTVAPMELIRQGLDLDFMSRRRFAVMFSSALLVVSILSLAIRGSSSDRLHRRHPRGGGLSRAVELEPVRATLSGAGFEGAVVQHFGTAHDVLIRIAPRDDVDKAELSNRALDALRARESAVELRRSSSWVRRSARS